MAFRDGSSNTNQLYPNLNASSEPETNQQEYFMPFISLLEPSTAEIVTGVLLGDHSQKDKDEFMKGAVSEDVYLHYEKWKIKNVEPDTSLFLDALPTHTRTICENYITNGEPDMLERILVNQGVGQPERRAFQQWKLFKVQSMVPEKSSFLGELSAYNATFAEFCIRGNDLDKLEQILTKEKISPTAREAFEKWKHYHIHGKLPVSSSKSSPRNHNYMTEQKPQPIVRAVVANPPPAVISTTYEVDGTVQPSWNDIQKIQMSTNSNICYVEAGTEKTPRTSFIVEARDEQGRTGAISQLSALCARLATSCDTVRTRVPQELPSFPPPPPYSPPPLPALDVEETSRPKTQLKLPEVMNILILGETVVGKSTFINGLVNYLKYDSIAEALDKGVEILIPSRFSLYDDDVSFCLPVENIA